MSFLKYIAIAALCCTTISTLSAATQTTGPVTWSQDLEFLQGLTPAEAVVQQKVVQSIRHEVEHWIAAHPDQKVELSAAPALPWSSEQTQAQIKELVKAVTILAANTTHPFHLGQTEVVVSTTVSPLSPNAAVISQDQLQATNIVRATDALKELPGVEVVSGAGMRNEATYYLRGFSNTEVPLYLDGIPQYVPYDGRIDLGRFLTSELAEVQVTRGYSSALLGPGALAGSINMVTREPKKPYEADLAIGTGAGNQLNSSGILGRRAAKYFLQQSADWASLDYTPLPGGYTWPTGGYTNYPSFYKQLSNEYPNSATTDQKYGSRIGWTPRSGDEYVFSFTTQKGNKSPLPYLGVNSSQSPSKYKWPYWNKKSYYFLSNTKLSEKNDLKSRIYYDEYQNRMQGYSDKTFSTLTYDSMYQDHTSGGSLTFHSTSLQRNAIGGAIIFKDDTHHELSYGSMMGSSAASSTVYPWRTLRDQQTTFGIEDLITVTSRLHVTVGLSVDHMSGKTVQVYSSSYTTSGDVKYYSVQPNTCASNPSNTSYSGCAPHYTETNPQAVATYALTNSDTVYASFAYRGAYPTMSQMFMSSANGKSVPNPNLKEEHGTNWNFGYTRVFNRRLTTDVQLFRSSLTDAIVSGTGYTSDSSICPYTTTTTVVDGVTYYGCGTYWNAGKTTNQGVEFEAHARPISRVAVDASYAYLNRHIEDSEISNIPSEFTSGTVSSTLSSLYGIPRHKVAALATINAPRGIVGIIRERYEGSIGVYDTSTAGIALHESTAGYWKTAMAVTDIGVTAPMYKGVKLQTGVNNLLDRYYFYTAGYPQAGRSWYLNLRYQF